MLPQADVPEQVPKVRAAGAQHHPVGLDPPAVGREGDVHKVLLLLEAPKGGRERGLVVVPPEAQLVVGAGHGGTADDDDVDADGSFASSSPTVANVCDALSFVERRELAVSKLEGFLIDGDRIVLCVSGSIKPKHQ